MRNETSYSSELPEALILKLSPEPDLAARQLCEALEADWRPDPEVRSAWLDRFHQRNVGVVGNILSAIQLEASQLCPEKVAELPAKEAAQ